MLTLPNTMAEISCGENCFVCPRYSTSTLGFPSSSTTLKGHDSMSFLTVGSSNLRPIRRLLRGQSTILHLWTMLVLDIKHRVRRVHRRLILGRIADEALFGGEGDEGRGGECSLIVGDCRRTSQSL